MKGLLLISLMVICFAFANAACLFNSSHCQCSQGHNSGLCLRYNAKTEGSKKCLVDNCQASYKCDCLGSSICPLDACTKYKWAATASSIVTISPGEQVDCTAENGACVGAPTDEIASPCIHNSTHCQCASGHAGGLCLRFISGSLTDANCIVENCQEGGFKCDCMGEEMCELRPCRRWVMTTTNSSLQYGSTVPCRYVDPGPSSPSSCTFLIK